ncbi:CG8910 [Drosophila busckii]|uniref:CG8910 n=1 Tax=Drosophila busckii TaxID=30019 RepID=A0A0M4E6I2_DROBS|nr:CG8910 [Drosophila busckii]
MNFLLQDKLLSKLEEESEPDPPTSQEDECVICINARATMQTSPCGHRVVCRRCFVKTIQSAVAQRLLPLRCVICRARVNRLTSSSGSWRIQESASSYSMGAKSWSSASVRAGGVVASASSYSMNDAHSEHHAFQQPTLRRAAAGARHPYQSDSLYSMSSTGSVGSTLSGYSHYSKTSSITSSGACSPASPAAAADRVRSNHLAPPMSQHQQQQQQLHSPSGSGSSSVGSLSPREPLAQHSHHHGGCPSGCSGAVPRKPLHTLSQTASASSCSSSSSSSSGGGSGSGAMTPLPMPTHTYPGRRHIKSRLLDLQNRLPPIKEFRSPAKVPHPSPVHVSNPRFRYASYTKSSGHELAPLLRESASPPPPRRPSPMNIQLSCSALAPPPLKAGGAKIVPLTSKHALPKNAYVMPKDKKPAGAAASSSSAGKLPSSVNNKSSAAAPVAANAAGKPHSSASSRSFPLFASSSSSNNNNNNNNNSELHLDTLIVAN